MGTTYHTKDEYREFCSNSKHLPVFYNDWWLDIVCSKDGWGVIFISIQEHTILVLPYTSSYKYFLKLSRMPQMTPYIGPYLHSTLDIDIKKQYRYHRNLIEHLPNFDFFCQKWPVTDKSWYPYYVKGYQQTSSYTYVLDSILDLDNTYKRFSADVKRRIERTAEKYHCKLITDPQNLIRFVQSTFDKQNLDNPLEKEKVSNLIGKTLEERKGFLLACYNERDEEVGANFIVYDRKEAFNILQGVEFSHLKHGITQRMLWESIKNASTCVTKFNFEGSMLPQIEKVYRQFGAEQKAYNIIYKDRWRWITLLRIYLNKFKIR